MKQTIYLNDFRDAFVRANRNNFSYEGLEALYNHLEEVDPNFDLDVIALCCEYTEFESLEEYNKDYSPVESIEDIEDLTTVIRVGKEGFIIQNY